MKKASIAVVGPGLIGIKHVELVQAHLESELAAIVAPSSAPDHLHNVRLAHKLGVPFFNSIQELLTSRNPDGIIISSPNKFHVEQALQCIHAGIPTLVEKPIAHSYIEGLKIAELVEKKKAKLIVGHHRAHSPIMAASKKIILNNTLGKLVAIMGSALFYKPTDYFLAGPWRKESGGGPILINLIHEIGNYRYLCGEIHAVQAISSNAIRNFSVEDTVAINLQFKNGVLGTFILSDVAASAKSWELTSHENKSYPNYKDEDCYSISGTLGSLSIPTMRIKKYLAEGEQSWWKPLKEELVEVDKKDPLECQLDHFIKVIKGTENPIVTAYDGLQNLLITEAIVQSAQTRQIIYV
jgi:predicted dehydrogenase